MKDYGSPCSHWGDLEKGVKQEFLDRTRYWYDLRSIEINRMSQSGTPNSRSTLTYSFWKRSSYALSVQYSSVFANGKVHSAKSRTFSPFGIFAANANSRWRQIVSMRGLSFSLDLIPQ